MLYQLQWVPSASEGVDSQTVLVEDLKSGEEIAQETVKANATLFRFKAGPAKMIKCTVAAKRGDEIAADSITYQTAQEPLKPPTGLVVGEQGIAVQPLP